MLFVKYLSDVSKERREEYIKQYDGDMRRVERAMSRERFAIDEQSTFDYLYANRNDAEIGQKINVALNHIEEHNSGKLRNVFRAIDFNSQVDFGEPKEKNATLRNLLEDFNGLDVYKRQGVDSSVVAALLIKAIGKQLTCVHVNHGLMRKGESESVVAVSYTHLDVYKRQACARGTADEENVPDPL